MNGEPAALAVKARVERILARDPFPNTLGIRCIDAGTDRAVVQLEVGPGHLNSHGSCHGGLIFALGDTAFGLASNSHGPVAVGIDVHIAYHAAARLGDLLIATATQVHRNRRLCTYRIEISAAGRGLVASFTGTAYVTDRPNEVAADTLGGGTARD
ncbi:MAG: hotdog fold thioesterase [Burkholderiales bacterium]|nr:hotdog fold thioesterase [Burkholderiales bacterium]